ncbi:hypothetical protein [Myxococcus landrumensis]|uniref:Lipoprotein n=1 Tax=Myxococcus landrumensis TaxID=2813577 RepID=A0ABX7MZ04_9BACT|nr:hypothetical protein [Myxococcus landrumus]QSQ11443.1 hypothetical protein JY572_23890 [Myxococcus landrumus]
MTAFARVFRPTVLLVSLVASACGGPPEGGDLPAPEQGRQALAPLTVTVTRCYMLGFGRPNFTCEGFVTGGTLPYNYFGWTGVANAATGLMTFTGPDSTQVNGRCAAFQTAQVRFSVSDAAGVTADGDFSFPCMP